MQQQGGRTFTGVSMVPGICFVLTYVLIKKVLLVLTQKSFLIQEIQKIFFVFLYRMNWSAALEQFRKFM